jgi:hypothetical protein
MTRQTRAIIAEQSRPTINRRPWNRGRPIGQKPPLKLREIWAIRTRLELADRLRELALFNVAIDSKLRRCDIVALGRATLSGQLHRPVGGSLQWHDGGHGIYCQHAIDVWEKLSTARNLPAHSMAEPRQVHDRQYKAANATEVFVPRRSKLRTTRQMDVAVGNICGRSGEPAVALHLLQLRRRHDLVRDPIRHGTSLRYQW